MMRHLLNKLIRPLDLVIVKARHLEMIYQYNYPGGYEEYRATQILHNKRKLSKVWADRYVLSAIVNDLRDKGLGGTGICHGARNGFEVDWLRNRLNTEVIGTDISETAVDFPHMHVWDFHKDNPDWYGQFDFVYTNSLDQAMEPARALNAWSRQINSHGRIYIEHTMEHSTRHANAMDPFGAHPMVMPYLFFTWGRGRYELVDIMEIEAKQNNRLKAWIFVLMRTHQAPDKRSYASIE